MSIGSWIVSVFSDKITDKFSLPQYKIGSPSRAMPLPSRNDNVVNVSEGNGNANDNVDCCLWCFPLCTIPEQKDIPEHKMTLWAVRLAFLEKAGSRLGTMKFIWATAILLGGFVSSLESIDFWFVSIILVVGGLRIFGRRSELAPSSPYFDGEFMIMKIHSAIIQEYASLTCLLLSGYRLTREKYGSESSPNQNEALNIFYWLSVAESLLILFVFFLKIGFGISPLWLLNLPESPNLQDSPNLPESPNLQDSPNLPEIIRRGFWKLFSWICRGKLIYDMRDEYKFDDSQLRTIHRFFYDTYSRCINGSIFHGLKMEFVSYSVELLQCSDGKEQLAGVQLLSAVVKHCPLALQRIRATGTVRDVVEMLINMLNWGEPDEKKFGEPDEKKTGEPDEKKFREAAAQIISNLVKIHRHRILVITIPRSMESIVSLLCIQCADVYHTDFSLLGLAIDTLTSLAREPEVRESIRGTAGVLHNLLSLFFKETTLFFKETIDDKNQELVNKAGEALGFLSLENKQNCEIMINIKLDDHRNLIARLISVLNEPVQGIYAAKILRNLRAYAEPDCVELIEITAASAKVVVLVMEKQGAHQEAAIGLAAQIFKFMNKSNFDSVFKEGGAEKKRSLISKLVEVFRSYPSPSKEVPSIRRFSIELLIAVMEKDRSTIEMRSELEDALKGVMETTSELESYSTFSGTLGLSSHRMAIRSLVKSAMSLLRN